MEPLGLIEAIVYINLKKRDDRRKSLLQELKKLRVNLNKVFRIEAFEEKENGTRACVRSHIQALELAYYKKWKSVLILEDDVIFSLDPEKISRYIASFLRHFQDKWDVFFLGTEMVASKPTDHPFYFQILFSIRAHAYLVNGPYVKSLRDFFIRVYRSMQKDESHAISLKKGLDKEWVHLQMKDRWFCGKSIVAFQKKDFSDIDQKLKNQR